ncbi:MAG: hypothetical protein ACKVTZ_09110, partial [Bacteroidia bacterium]
QIAEKQLFITGVEMNMGEIRQLDATWSSPCFEPIREDFGFKRPPFEKEQPSRMQITNEELQKMADRRLSAPASLATGVYVPIK